MDFFLFDLKRGYFDYQATAMTVMLRTLGIPARVAVGYAIDAGAGTETAYTIKKDAAYSWVEVFFPEYGWVTFNPTPDRPGGGAGGLGATVVDPIDPFGEDPSLRRSDAGHVTDVVHAGVARLEVLRVYRDPAIHGHLELSRIESGRFNLDVRPGGAPHDLLDSASRRMKLQVERAGLTLRVECEENLPRVQMDIQRLEQVLVNLIHNAVKFTRPGGEILLEAEAGHGQVRFAVRDTGIGIPAEYVSRIFERFYRVDKSRTGSGTGLGLSIAKHIVEAHQGRIWVESIEGQGSTFLFTLRVS